MNAIDCRPLCVCTIAVILLAAANGCGRVQESNAGEKPAQQVPPLSGKSSSVGITAPKPIATAPPAPEIAIEEPVAEAQEDPFKAMAEKIVAEREMLELLRN